jgi:polar amino acid transport system substrate-binding protein
MSTPSIGDRRAFFKGGAFIAITLLLALVLSSVAGGAQTLKPLRLVSTPWTPFTDGPGKPRFAVDLVHAALERAGIASDTTIVDEGKLTSSLLNGEFDGSPALWKDDERVKTLVFSQPYLENRLVLVGHQGSDTSATSLAKLSGKRIALVQSYAYGDAIRSPSGPTYVTSSSEEDSLRMVLDGKADYTLMDQLVVEYILKNYPEEARTRLSFGTTPVLVRTLHFAVRRAVPNAVAIVDQFNAQILGMIADRTYHRTLQLDWIEADVDGDGIAEYVPRNDQVGPIPPPRSYPLLSSTTSRPAPTGPRFYLGGKVYPSWSSVPESYKYPLAPGTLSHGSEFQIFTFKF